MAPPRRPEASRSLLLLCVAAAATLATAQRGSGGGNSLSNRAYLSLMLERPGEPLYYGAKGRNDGVTFSVPDSYVPNRYKSMATTLSNRFGNTTRINIPAITVPDISLPMQLDRQAHFSLFVPYHRQMAKRLIDVFMGMRSYEDFTTAAAFCRQSINPYMFSYALRVAILHRNDTAGVQLPALPSAFPEMFVDRAVFSAARRETNLADVAQRIAIEIPMDWTATDLEPEHRVAYFREDVGVNVNHHSWHLVYPFNGPREIVNKDRRGELFYYFHQQIIARYNFERFSNRLPRVQRLLNWRERVPEAYFSKLDTLLASRVWPPRPSGMLLSDIKREDMQITFDIGTLERWRDRIIEAIHGGRVQTTNGSFTPLDERRGIDILGNMMEASPELTPNFNLYGDMHNMGHVVLGLCHDPDHRHLETFSVIADPTTAMRDPVFYRWHSFIDDVFHQHKQTLAPYTVQQLGFDGIGVVSATIQTQGLNRPNEFNTFWQQSDLDLSQGLDFVPRGPVYVRVTHLQHTPFSYRIQVTNSGAERIGTVRIFIAPRIDERGTPLSFREQRLFYIEMDKFQFNFKRGNNTILRPSTNSSVTVPFEQTFRNLTNNLGQEAPVRDELNYCGCGWPQHMLVPKGSAEGMAVHLFVMVSNYADDRVDAAPQPTRCSQGHSYCGVFNQRYPDRRPMGYPFDRLPRQGVATLEQFLTSNMVVTPVTIRFTGQTVRPANSPTTVVGPGSRPNRPASGSAANAGRPSQPTVPANRSANPNARRVAPPGRPSGQAGTRSRQ